jgi:hypothetical protein
VPSVLIKYQIHRIINKIFVYQYFLFNAFTDTNKTFEPCCLKLEGTTQNTRVIRGSTYKRSMMMFIEEGSDVFPACTKMYFIYIQKVYVCLSCLLFV